MNQFRLFVAFGMVVLLCLGLVYAATKPAAPSQVGVVVNR